MLSGAAAPNEIVVLADTPVTVAVTRTLPGVLGALTSKTALLPPSGVTVAEVPSVAAKATERLPIGIAPLIAAVTVTSEVPSAGAAFLDALIVMTLSGFGGV